MSATLKKLVQASRVLSRAKLKKEINPCRRNDDAYYAAVANVEAAALELAAEFDGRSIFPFGINPEMDEWAKDRGLPHWSCVSPKSNALWVRADGYEVKAFDRFSQLPDALEEFDRDYPMTKEGI